MHSCGNCLLMILSIFFLTACGSMQAEEFRQKGYLALEDGERQKAIELFEESLKLEPDSFNSNRHLGRQYYLEGQYDKAEKVLKKALEQNDKSAIVWNNLGWLYIKKGDGQRARESFEAAIANRTQKSKYDHQGLAQAFFLLGRFDEHEKYLREALKLNTSDKSDFFADLGDMYYFFSDYEKAGQYLEMAVAERSDNVRAWNKLGWTGLWMRNYRQAREAFEKAIRYREKKAAWDRAGLGLAYFGLGDRDVAEKQFAAALTLDESIQGELNDFKQVIAASHQDYDTLLPLFENSPTLGVKLRDLDGRVRVDAVFPGTLADLAGLKVGDMINAFDNRSLNASKIFKEIQAAPFGATHVLELQRDGAPLTMQLVFDFHHYLPGRDKGATAAVAAVQDEQDIRPVLPEPEAHGGGAAVPAALMPEAQRERERGTKARRASSDDLSAGAYYALIIGVSEYDDEKAQDLAHPIVDARKVAQILQEYSFGQDTITILENPSRKTVIDAFDVLSKEVGSDDNLLIFYAGHGFWDEQFNQGYWLPSDASTGSRANWLSNSTVRDYIRGIKSRHTLLVSDACFSGSIFTTRKAFSETRVANEHLYRYPSRKAITSGTNAEVPDKSAFVKYFVKRLKENQAHYLSAEKLFVALKEAVINNSPLRQIPQFGVIREAGDEGGDFIFIRPE